MFWKKRIFFFAAGLLLLSACSNPEKEAGGMFRYNESAGISTLDPAFARNQAIMWPIHQLYSTLIEPDSNGNMQPLIAKRWELSPDRLEYTFYLRDDVFFHDDPCFSAGKGRKLVADDIVYSFQRIMDPATASSGAWIFNSRVDTTDPFHAVDDTTFRLRLLRPYGPILGILSMQYCSIVPKEAVDYYGADFRRHPVGSGPFRFRAWEEDLALVLRRNENYFEKDSNGVKLPYLDGVHISFYDSKATEFLLFRQHKLDFINDIDASFKDEVLTRQGGLREEWEGRIILNTHPYLNTEYLGILVDSTNPLIKDSPLRIKKIRQAINYGFDRRKMILYLRNSMGTPAESGFVPAGLPSFDSSQVKGYHYDPEKCRQLLTEAGFPGGNGLPVIKLLSIPVYAEMAGFIARQLQESGFRIQVEVVQKSLLLMLTAQSEAAFFRGSWIADYPDAENYLSVFYSKNPAPPNYTRYKNPEYDLMLETAIAQTNDSLRYEYYRRADQIMINDAPIVPLWYDKVIHLVQPGVKDFRPNSQNLLELRKCRKR